MVKDQVFQIREGVWWVIVDGKTFGDWDNKGAALAGMETEQRRAAKRIGAGERT